MRAEPPPSAGREEVLLYQSAATIHPRRARGRFARLRVAAMLVLLGVFYGLPWLQWQGHPAVLVDLPLRRFQIFSLLLVPQDLLLLAGLLLIAALTLFLFTSLAGRLWCGYACPQTVWTEAFLWIEQFCEGDRYSRIKLDRSPWNARKLLRRGGKHLLWGSLALFTGMSFVAYFVPARELFPDALRLEIGGWSGFWVLFYSFATWGNAGFMREQVCKYMCPYARFQSAMFDRDTLIIAYDDRRGEPRKTAGRRTPAAATGRGDCVDCTLCVQVCPAGIDIRNGLQYECIACAACVDACDGTMDAIGRPRGLIRYSSARRESGELQTRLARPRTIGYGLAWLAACAGFAGLIITHSPLRFDVLRDRHSLFRERADGAIENLYSFKVTNADSAAHRYRIAARLADGTPLTATPDEIERAAGQATATAVTLATPARDERSRPLARVEPLIVELADMDDLRVANRRSARFLTGSRENEEQEHAARPTPRVVDAGRARPAATGESR